MQEHGGEAEEGGEDQHGLHVDGGEEAVDDDGADDEETDKRGHPDECALVLGDVAVEGDREREEGGEDQGGDDVGDGEEAVDCRPDAEVGEQEDGASDEDAPVAQEQAAE